MGDLLVLPAARPRNCAFVAGAEAEILFFTGVRYYRFDETVEATSSAPQPRRRRSPRAKRRSQRPVELQA